MVHGTNDQNLPSLKKKKKEKKNRRDLDWPRQQKVDSFKNCKLIPTLKKCEKEIPSVIRNERKKMRKIRLIQDPQKINGNKIMQIAAKLVKNVRIEKLNQSKAQGLVYINYLSEKYSLAPCKYVDMAIKNFWHDVADTFYEISFKIQRIKNFVVHKIT